MEATNIRTYSNEVLKNMPSGWLSTTTHRLDIYDEKLAKTQFLEQFEALYNDHNAEPTALASLPTAYDYIRLGHPLSCVLEWGIAKLNKRNPDHIICFSSMTMPILSILRKNLLEHKKTQIVYTGELTPFFDPETLQRVYGYQFELHKIAEISDIPTFNGSTIFIEQQATFGPVDLVPSIDFYITLHPNLGSVIIVNGAENETYIPEIQHVRRRESIAMTPINCLAALKSLVKETSPETDHSHIAEHKTQVLTSIKEITGASTTPLVASSGLSIQYAIMMGLIDDALDKHPGKAIKFIVPPNCYGGTNDQARRIAACLDHVEVIDLLVDGDNDMVESIDSVLTEIAKEDAIPYIIAEIPTNPRVEVPDLKQLNAVLRAERKTVDGKTAIDPVFILDQTFCPNVLFLGENAILSNVRTISYASGSKFPSGGLCTAGYCVGNKKTVALIKKIEKHLLLCDNEATQLQYELLAKQLPSMNQRINDAYKNTREFVHFIRDVLPAAKINFVSDKLAAQGFTPSVFSLDLPSKGNTSEEKETYKRALNLILINLMISEIPNESKFCVSYGQLKGCYWTIPATSTQGTTKEGDKDYIVRVALSPNVDLDLHKKIFLKFIEEHIK
ncbi:PLP-dependent transferase [Flavobacteriaceae bacterium F08102]|nr:PLP-dependent transferase [Flavobacteriaceae bacterium F08102]